ncbi:MAG: flagellar type III secretion system pore protein FliP [Deltaproteobacteria bacterium]|nr:flagellar type III secretion system pore protein FliP [Deltaproteobacteria bacterium]
MPLISINTDGKEMTNPEVYSGLKIVAMLTALVFLPSIIMSGTCFTRIAIVLAMVRQALGTAQTPPNQVIIGIALFLTFAIMGPIFNDVYTQAIVPFSEDQISTNEALEKAFKPVKTFMLRQTREQDLALFIEMQKLEQPKTPEDLGALVIVPAFMLSELNTAYQIAFLIYLPFLVLDMIISSVLTSMSMITLPPTVISLPIKLMLFVIIDGWHLIIGNLVNSYHM